MRIKKMVVITLVSLLMLSFTSPLYAANSNIPKAVYDKEKKPHKTFSPQKLKSKDGGDVGIMSEKMWTADVNMYNPLLYHIKVNAYSESKDGDSRWAIDRIMAKARAYADGDLKDSKIDDNDNASYASCTADMGENQLPGVKYEGYGNHAFEESGYQSWYPETYDDNPSS